MAIKVLVQPHLFWRLFLMLKRKRCLNAANFFELQTVTTKFKITKTKSNEAYTFFQTMKRIKCFEEGFEICNSVKSIWKCVPGFGRLRAE